jgi:hypothetical protein
MRCNEVFEKFSFHILRCGVRRKKVDDSYRSTVPVTQQTSGAIWHLPTILIKTAERIDVFQFKISVF